jgi:hypothetical protein
LQQSYSAAVIVASNLIGLALTLIIDIPVSSLCKMAFQDRPKEVVFSKNLNDQQAQVEMQ